jgi:ribosomal protein S18 acetylase RimI-like enzyme
MNVKKEQGELMVRPAEPADAAACHEMRRRAYREVFSRYLDGPTTVAGADAYTVEEFAGYVGGMPTSIAEEDGEPVGFCTVRRLDEDEAELLWLYVRLDHLRRGIGSLLALHAEELAQLRFPGVARLVLVTVVPEYNQAFYEGLGYRKVGEERVSYPTASVDVVRLRKNLKGGDREAAD